jgi:HAD superfamily hydrolase (TIGR01509 family)
MITTIIFDLDGLLADTEGLHFQSYCEVLAQHGVDIDLTHYIEHWIRRGLGVTAWAAEHGLTLDAPLIRRQKFARYRELVQTTARPMPGAPEALQRLHGQWRLALASASHGDSVRWVLECLGMTAYFEDILSGDDVARAKPFPDIFLASARNLNVEPAECLVLEDAERGVRAAHSAGMTSIAIPNRYTRAQDFTLAARVVASLHDVTPALIASLCDIGN